MSNVRMCVTKCATNNYSSDAVIRMVCIFKHQMLFALYLTLPWFFDDSNLLCNEISRGDEMKPN
jgi:hypothetical protein